MYLLYPHRTCDLGKKMGICCGLSGNLQLNNPESLLGLWEGILEYAQNLTLLRRQPPIAPWQVPDDGYAKAYGIL